MKRRRGEGKDVSKRGWLIAQLLRILGAASQPRTEAVQHERLAWRPGRAGQAARRRQRRQRGSLLVAAAVFIDAVCGVAEAIQKQHLRRLRHVRVRAQDDVRAGAGQRARDGHLRDGGVTCRAEGRWMSRRMVSAVVHSFPLRKRIPNAPSNSWPQCMATMRRPQPAAAISASAATASLRDANEHVREEAMQVGTPAHHA
jgi:hypothetical protein